MFTGLNLAPQSIIAAFSAVFAFACGAAEGDDLYGRVAGEAGSSAQSGGGGATGGSSGRAGAPAAGGSSGAANAMGGAAGTSSATGSVSCGSAQTCPGNNFCCWLDNQNPACRGEGSDCTGSRIDCDGSDDCSAGQQCCARQVSSIDGKSLVITECRTTCAEAAVVCNGGAGSGCPNGGSCMGSDVLPALQICR